MPNPTEEWRPVVGYEGVYEVSDRGRVRRVKPGSGVRCLGLPKPLTTSARGYQAIQLNHRNKEKRCYVHRLVAAAFFGPCPDGLQVNHKDGNKLNNHAENLEYVTCAENLQHATIYGLVPRGERHCRAKLTADEVRAIRALGPDANRKRLAHEYGVDRHTIRDILRRRTWKHIT